VVALTARETTVWPSIDTLICGAPAHWSPLARTLMARIPVVEYDCVAVALLQIRSALPPLAAESVKTCPLLEGSDIDSASKPGVAAAAVAA
jgi:hypothetical protein